jgi:palmitoyltransferase ZDHHC2/15/20
VSHGTARLTCRPLNPAAKVAILLLLAPHPSILYVLLNYHYLTLHAPAYFIAHLLVIYTLSFLAFSSLIACVARDPGPIPEPKSEEAAHDADGGPASGGAGDEMSLQDALLAAPSADDYTQPGKWCRICWRPKPERAHHCSQCGRCVLKMGACGVSCRFVLTARAHASSPPSGRHVCTVDHHCPWMGAKCIVRRA